jgi:hypothetical protein
MTDTLTIRWRGPLGVVLLCLNGILSSPAIAQQLPLGELTTLLHPVAVYGDHDHRLNEADFAASVGESRQTIHDRYAATGTITCGNYEGTAEVTVKNDTIVTVAHMFYSGFTCNTGDSVSADRCVFSYTNSDGTLSTKKVKKKFDDGYKCPGTPDPKQDWAVLKLESPADGVTPYQVESGSVRGLKNGSSVVFVAHSKDWFSKSSSNRKIYPRHFQMCEVKNAYSVWEPVYYKTNCDGAEYSSGGGILDGNHATPILMGVNTANWETDKQLQQAIDSGVPSKGEYNENSWTNAFTPVAGDFLRAIEAAAGR